MGCERFADRRYADNVGHPREDIGEDVGLSWNAVFMQLYVSAKRPTLSA